MLKSPYGYSYRLSSLAAVGRFQLQELYSGALRVLLRHRPQKRRFRP